MRIQGMPRQGYVGGGGYRGVAYSPRSTAAAPMTSPRIVPAQMSPRTFGGSISPGPSPRGAPTIQRVGAVTRSPGTYATYSPQVPSPYRQAPYVRGLQQSTSFTSLSSSNAVVRSVAGSYTRPQQISPTASAATVRPLNFTGQVQTVEPSLYSARNNGGIAMDGMANVTGTGPAAQLQRLDLILKNPRVVQSYSQNLFRRNDLNNDGSLDFGELSTLVDRLHKDLGIDLGDSEQEHENRVANYIRRFDADRDGLLDEEEFLKLYTWLLWRRYEELSPPKFNRADFVSASKGSPHSLYNVSKKLGEGAFGIVHLVEHRHHKSKRVMKTVNKQKAIQSGTPLAMLENEIKVLILLDHPHILRLFEYFIDHENIYFLMDLCPEGELLEVVEEHAKSNKPIKEALIARIFEQVIHGMAHIHSKGVIHKDIKLENIMLRTPPEPVDQCEAVIIDVGLAELFGAQNHAQSRCTQIGGSLCTMAPEVLKQNFCHKCDIYSLSCVLFSMFMDKPQRLPDGKGGTVLYPYPFMPQPTSQDPNGVQSLLTQQRRGPDPIKIRRASSEAQDLIRKMMTFDERARPDAPTLLGHPYFKKVNHAQVHLSPEQVEALLLVNKTDAWRRATLIDVATQLPSSALTELEALFQSIDANNDGYLEVLELSQGLMQLGIAQEVAEQAAHAADADGDGHIEWCEFVAALLPAQKELLGTGLLEAFQCFDQNHDGTLSRNEVLALLRSGKVASHHLPAGRTAELMVDELFQDTKGSIDFHQFQEYFLKH